MPSTPPRPTSRRRAAARTFALAAALSIALAAAGCSGSAPAEPLSCTDHAACPADAFCRAGACVESAPPVARIASLGGEAPRVNRVLAFDASASSDPDAEDHVASYAWRAHRVAAACEPSIVEAAAATCRVLFPCPGDFRVEVVATDSTGASSAPAALALAVTADGVAAPALEAGAAIALQHRCEGEPLTCTTLDGAGETTFTLAATASGGRGPLALRWTASPPPGLATPHTAAFSDPTAAAPEVSLRTSGAIAGTWSFTVLATDADGRAAVAVQEVVVGNRPPALAEPLAAIAVHHRYDAAEAAYIADGTLVAAPRFVDPDGDPVSVRLAAESSGDGGHGFGVEPDGAFAIRVPAGEPQHLIGEGVVRHIAATADDGNGGRASAAVPVAVLNRAPRIAVSRSTLTVPHAYDAERRVYTAAATLSDYVDDDGDPIAPGSTFEQVPAGCSRLALTGATLALACEVPFSTVATLASLVRTHVLDVTVRDPWEPSARATARVEVTNRPPRVVGTYVGLRAQVSGTSICCYWDDYEDDCGAFPRAYTAADGAFSGIEDPDGDPLDVVYERTLPALQLSRGSVTACRGAECAVGLHADAAGSLEACVEIPELGSLKVQLTDGASSATSTVYVSR